MAADPDKQVFINCPYDPAYRPTFDAIIFAVMRCGFEPRSALEAAGSGQQRFDRMLALICACRLAIHDLSRVELSNKKLPRFNMPFELGLFVGAKHFGNDAQKQKDFLILEGRTGQCRKACSDLGGVDPLAHHGRPARVVEHVRTWLSGHTDDALPGAKAIRSDYLSFQFDLPRILMRWRVQAAKVSFLDFRKAARQWLKSRVLP